MTNRQKRALYVVWLMLKPVFVTLTCPIWLPLLVLAWLVCTPIVGIWDYFDASREKARRRFP